MLWNYASPRGAIIPIRSRFLFEAAYRGVHVKVIRRGEQTNCSESGADLPRELYFFYEKNTGVSHFHVEAGADGRFPVDQAAGLLAMHCLVRGQSPRDYVVMVQAAPGALEGLTEKAEQLLQAGHSVGSSVKLTRREEEVLGGIMRTLANKEIAASLNLSERTVKFHVSSLLAKFRVRGRMELVREAARHTATPMAVAQPAATRETRPSVPAPHTYRQVARNVGPIALTKRQLLA
jgi:DNA-binding CsgD family transcriptional regulator